MQGLVISSKSHTGSRLGESVTADPSWHIELPLIYVTVKGRGRRMLHSWDDQPVALLVCVAVMKQHHLCSTRP